MPNPAFIVEGDMEQYILDEICRGQPIRKVGCNGDSVTIDRVCDFIETQIRLLGNRNYPIFIIFDREKRAETAVEIRDTVIANLHARGLEDHDLRVFIPDREFEDWYLLDRESICRQYSLSATNIPLSGKGGLARLLRPSIDYHETTVGVELFRIVDLDTIAEQCDMFRQLILDALSINCASIASRTTVS